ncbi:MAG: transketolase family protein [Clostridium sp.]|uniref:transketolase family protein n=1 Tax=Clostridium sp. TaxID=1506 RepID=UPI002A8CB0CA|nr:transketolase family protein [Clostridium sp.]MDY5096854.1 transketolase family protein [Clostridium sp.]
MEINKKIATRESFGNALREYGEIYKDLIVLDADLAAATKTDIFKKKFPNRHIDCGIAESNMMGIAAGLSLSGKIPFVSSFAMFAAGRAFEQVRNSIGYPHLNVKIGATHGGISVGEDGATHQCNEDFALMRTIPGMVVLSPSDDIEARKMVKAVIQYEGPVYIRFGRSPVPIINESTLNFQIGKATCLREGKDITIVANGICVASALEAASKLEKEGIYAEVLNFSTIKPLDEDMLIKSATKTGKVVTVEEHSIIGGLGGAVCEYLPSKIQVPIFRIGIKDVFGESGPAEELIAKYQLDGQGVYSQIKTFLMSFKGEK